MDVSTFKAKHLIIQSVKTFEGTTGESSISLTDTDIKSGSADSGILVLSLSIDDQVQLGNVANFGTATSNTFIVMSAACIDDLGGRDVIGITDGNAIQATAVELDTTDPTIKSTKLDLTAKTLSVTFDEPMPKTGFDGTKITLQAVATSV